MDLSPIVLVEDNATDEMFALRAFRKNGTAREILVARDGQQALDLLLDPGAPVPAFVLLDLKLPKIDGYEVLRRVRAEPRTRFLPVIVLTSSTQEDDLRQCYLLGANSYVCKTLDIDEFTREIGAITHYWLNINHLPPSAAG
ncbi:MAG: response regulator [Burkholderiales bacterium]|jgi:two-component system, response regulator|nr:response regulator [Burkholderiales bacterium]